MTEVKNHDISKLTLLDFYIASTQIAMGATYASAHDHILDVATHLLAMRNAALEGEAE